MNTTSLPPLLQRALDYIDEEQQEPAAQIAVLHQTGYKDREIASMLQMSWFKTDKIRKGLQAGVVQVLRQEGHTDIEITGYLRVPSAMICWPEANAA